MATCPVQVFADPRLFYTPGARIPPWVRQGYRRLALVTGDRGELAGGYAALATHLHCSKAHAVHLVTRLRRLRLMVVLEAGQRGRGRATKWQLRRWFIHLEPRKGNQPPYKELQKNSKASPNGDDGPGWRRYAMLHLRRAVAEVKTLRQDQEQTITAYLGRLVWKLNLRWHQARELWGWITDVLPHHRVALAGRALIRWLLGKLRGLASPSTARWAREVAQADAELFASLDAPAPADPIVGPAEAAAVRAEVRAALVADGWLGPMSVVKSARISSKGEERCHGHG